jgi:hypothetical protein
MDLRVDWRAFNDQIAKRPTNCMPIGKPDFDQASGRLIAGCPVMFCMPVNGT